MTIETDNEGLEFESERKYVTVIFSDLSGYTKMSEALDPEEVKEILSDIYKRISKVIIRYDGFIEKFIGDAVLAIFGIPKIHEDDPIRALCAAQEIHLLMKEVSLVLKAKVKYPLTMHTGVNTGLIVTGEVNLERGTHGASGDTINFSARLSGIAKADEILISPNTYKILKDLFKFECLGSKKLKGKKNLIKVYRLISELYSSESYSDAATCRFPIFDINSPLVGREREIAIFSNKLMKLSDKSGQIITVSGSAGIGKSRFISEMKSKKCYEKNILWLEGRCLSYCKNSSFWPFNTLLKEFADINEKDNEKVVLEKLYNELLNLFVDKVDKIIPFIASLLSIETERFFKEKLMHLDGEAIKRQIFKSFRIFIVELSKKKPVVIIFEDLHWGDRASLELIEHIFPVVRKNQILICCVFRSNPTKYFTHFLDNISKNYFDIHTSLKLVSIDESNCRQLIKNILNSDNLPPKILHYIIKRTDGNPFFVEEIVRSLLDMKVLIRDEKNKCYKILENINHIKVPESLQGLIMARIDMLGDDLREVLKLASVIGRVFYFHVISNILKSENELRLKLTSLQAQNLIRIKRFLPDIEYIFKHALTQEVTYESILIKQRKELHQIVGDCIELLFKDRIEEYVSMLAFHYSCAENWNKAQIYLFRAGDKDNKIAADSETLYHYKKAKIAYETAFGDNWEPFQKAVIDRKIGESLFRKGHHQQALEFFLSALTLLGFKIPNTYWFIRVSIFKEIIVQLFHRFFPFLFFNKLDDKTNKELEEIYCIYEMIGWIDFFMNRERLLLVAIKSLNYAERRSYHSGIARSSMGIGIAFDLLGLNNKAKKYYQHAMNASNKTRNPIDVAHSYLGIAFHEEFQGNWKNAVKNYRKSAHFFIKIGDIKKWGDPIIMIIFLLNYKGYFKASINLSKKLIKNGDNCGDLQLLGWGMHGKGLGLYYSGKLKEAEKFLTKSVFYLESASDYYGCGIAKKDLGLCYLKQGNIKKAKTIIEKTLQLFESQKLKGHFVTFLHNALAETYLFDHEKIFMNGKVCTKREVKKACKLAVKESAKYCWAKPQAYRINGVYYWNKGLYKKAEIWWDKSLKVASFLGADYEINLTKKEIFKRANKNNFTR